MPKVDKFGVPYSCQNNNCGDYSRQIYSVELKGGTSTYWCSGCITRDSKHLKKVFMAKEQREKPKKQTKNIKGFVANHLPSLSRIVSAHIVSDELEADFEDDCIDDDY